MRNPITSIFTLLFFTGSVQAQVPQKIIVEHFTNTLCVICASRNPGFYQNLQQQQGVLHIAVHPSAPYSNCYFNKQNPKENDDRTKLYGVYGSTPRLVIQGKVIANNANYSSNSLFTPYLNKTSPIKLSILQEEVGDSFQIRIVLTTMASHTLGTQRLFAAVVEDTINYSAANGEEQHFDVFRKSVFSAEGIYVKLPSRIGDSLVLIRKQLIASSWNAQKIYALGILQDSADLSVTQVERSTKSNKLSVFSSGNFKNQASNIRVWTTENNEIRVDLGAEGKAQWKLFDIYGKLVDQKNILEKNQQWLMNRTIYGVYFYQIESEGTIVSTGKIWIR